ncbi:DNA double-strand break repair nuclease NurA [Synechococcus sp. H60.4]|uniref:DNA double-strand break repair nuclease NurA n=1 Tax=unclassified Synechococcus TaxID=2626047 RepID=UPI0039C0A0C1
MVFRADRVLAVLQQKREAFVTFDQGLSERREGYRQAMKSLCRWSSAEIAEKTALLDFPGALPTQEWDLHSSWAIPFKQQWASYEESCEWAKSVIKNIPTFAVDGSQIYPSKDLSIPVALVQIGWYENHHCAQGLYEKDIQVDVLTPKDLGSDSSGEPKERVVNMRRFQMETEKLVEYIRRAQLGSRKLAFLDGALVATFAEALEPESRDFYVQCLLQVLRASEQNRIPIVAYIDTTYTSDLVTLLRHCFDLPEAPQLHDAQLLSPWLEWGERTPFFICARGGSLNPQDGILNSYQEMRERVGFIYLRTNNNFPARLEIPVWVYEAGLLDWVVDLVRCEVIIGRGYPYVLETADQIAVIRNEDRNLFLRLMQDWASREKLSLRLSQKTVSKLQRRRVR